MEGCGGGGKQTTDDLIKVDVTKNYSSTKEMILQDFTDVEYIALETNDDFVNQGVVMDIGKEIILIKNEINDGNIFVYDRNGKAIRKINHKGQSPEEYTRISTIVLDDDNGEMFVYDSNLRKFFVYDLYGNIKRSFNHKSDVVSQQFGNLSIKENTFYTEIFNYDNNNLICYNQFNAESVFVLLSKWDGNITKEIKIPFKEKKRLEQTHFDGEYIYVEHPGSFHPIIPYNGEWILLEISSDTVYSFLPDYNLCPFIVRTPSVQSMNPEIILILRLISERYYFMETISNEYSFDTRKGFPRIYFMYDKKEKTFRGCTVYNGDFLVKTEVGMDDFRTVNQDIGFYCILQAYQLVEFYKKSELKDGRLKEIAATLDEEDNPVIMLVKHKK